MSGKNNLIFTLIFVATAFFVIQFLIYYNHSEVIRSENSLLHQYYTLLDKKPAAAKNALDIIAAQYPQSQTAYKELGYWHLRHKDKENALKYFLIAQKNNPQDQVISQIIAKLLPHPEVINRPLAMKAISPGEMREIVAPLKIIPKKMDAKDNIIKVVSSDRMRLLNEFYNNKKNNKKLAWHALKLLLKSYPNDVLALKEAGFYALSEKNYELAFHYLDRAYLISRDPKIALQNGYILDLLKRKRLAYYYFHLATHTDNLEDRKKSEIALTNLRTYQIKFLPDPLFFDFYADPFYYSRFQMTVIPIISRLGVTLNEKYFWETYLSYRRTSDNRSNLSNGLPQVFDDNVAIYAVGTRITPIPRIPVSIFLEGGRAKDLIYRNRPRWRGDFRGGLSYYQECGREARYSLKPILAFHFVGDAYADAIYYSRYRNYIFTLRVRPGWEIFRYGTSTVDLYGRLYLSEDTQREFFNNLLELSVGLKFVPTDRLNMALRFEFTQGHYLPAGGPSINPYGPKYHNNLFGLNLFLRI